MAGEPKPTIPRDLFIIDESVRSEYYYIEEPDTCYYIWEYMSNLWRGGERPDYSQYPANSLISNLKLSPSLRSTSRYYWKARAIQYVASALGKLLPAYWRDESVTYVPIPPSKPTDDPEYDSRLTEVLSAVYPRIADIRPLVVLSEKAFDAKQKGIRPADRAACYTIDEDYSDPAPESIILFDDVLTTGCHYKAIEMVLKERYPEVDVVGLFLARTVRPVDEGLDLFGLFNLEE